jgi:murein DD-endopeptidase MepM/ murein hydrolase activator NlpD
VPHDLPPAEQPTRLSRRALRAQAAGLAAALAQAEAAASSDRAVAVPERRSAEVAPVAHPPAQIAPAASVEPATVEPAAEAPATSKPTPAETVPLTRRQRRALAQTAAHKPVDLVSVEADDAAAAPATPLEAAAEAPDAESSIAIDEVPAPEVIAPTEPAEPAEADEPAEQSEPVEADASSSSDDPFVEAVRAFGATGETPVIRDAAESGRAEEADHVAPRRPRRLRRVMATTTASLGVMGIVGALAVGLTTPIGAIAAPAEGENPATLASASGSMGGSKADIQAFVAPADVTAEALEASSSYASTSYSELAAAEGINASGAAFTNDPTADIQWPFLVGVGISSPYGYRWGRLHEGLDFVPGAGAPIQAIADGTVRIATEAGGSYGVNVYIDHIIDGQLVTSHYAHMQYGSLRVVPGQRVEVGDIIGLTGNTGRSYGAHLHFEIIIGGSTIDPLPWLQKWAGTHYPDEAAAEPAGESEASEG